MSEQEFEELRRFDFTTIQHLLKQSYDTNNPMILTSHSDYYRGFGKSKLINELSLMAMSDGKQVIILSMSPSVEYFADKVISSRDNFDNIRGLRFEDYVVLADEFDKEKLELLSRLFDVSKVIGFIFDDSYERILERREKERTNE